MEAGVVGCGRIGVRIVGFDQRSRGLFVVGLDGAFLDAKEPGLVCLMVEGGRRFCLRAFVAGFDLGSFGMVGSGPYAIDLVLVLYD